MRTKLPENQLNTVLQENRKFAPSPDFQSKSYFNDPSVFQTLYEDSIREPEVFWGKIAEEFHWFKRWDKVLDDSERPFFKWFTGGKTNVTYNCVDRHIQGPNKNKAALIWEGEPGEARVLTYMDLYREVNQFANAIKKLGIKKGDRVAIYLPMIPELVISVLACAKVGAVHSVIFAGFAADSIKDRVLDSEASMVITADGGWRRGKPLSLKKIVDEGIEDCDCVKDVVIVKRSSEDSFQYNFRKDRDHWYHEIISGESIHCPAEKLDSEDLLFLLYTSGTTGKPKGIMHTQGGYMVYTATTAKYVFDLQPGDVYWCTADIGWITGHSYLIYGPLANAATCLMYEGAPNYPDFGRFWQMVEKYGVTVFYTAPTAIRAFMKVGEEWPGKYDLSSLRLLGSVGEPINPEAWMWYHQFIGGEKCPIVDTWWQTETGGIMISPIPGITETKPGSAVRPFLGIDATILDEEGNETTAGLLAIRQPWPSILRGIYGDTERFKNTYWSHWQGQYYFPGDGAKCDEDGYLWLLGRVDDVVNVSGHRIGTAELESVYVEHPSTAESAVIAVEHEIKGQGLVSFVTLKQGVQPSPELEKELNEWVAKKIGKFAVPEKIIFSADLPKTRSGKIMRRLLRDIAEGRALGNITTLADPSVVASLQASYEED
ncbi:MAG: acetate--CoA ligase [Verrucomicrobiota bacterium]